MKRTLVKFRKSKFRKFIQKHEKYLPIVFFIGGFIFDSLTLGRIDRLYDTIVLCLHMTGLSMTVYLYNISEDGKLRFNFLERYKVYLPLAIQFFFGALSSAYVVYFSRSVSLSKTASFFVILVALLFANEILKKRISNKYLQLSVYFFISYVFFAFMIPVFLKEMNTTIFIISGGVSLVVSIFLSTLIYIVSPSTRAEIHLGKLIGLILTIYALVNLFYYLRLIPPVPLALQNGIIAHDITLVDNTYKVTYERKKWYVFWREHKSKFSYQSDESVYIFTSIFAPTDLDQSILHRWSWYNESTKEWELVEDIGYDITGGRDDGYRGYTFKNNVKQGEWRVEVLTNEELVLGVIDFEIVIDSPLHPNKLSVKKF